MEKGPFKISLTFSGREVATIDGSEARVCFSARDRHQITDHQVEQLGALVAGLAAGVLPSGGLIRALKKMHTDSTVTTVKLPLGGEG